MSEALRRQALAIYSEGLAAITPEVLMQRALRLEGDTLHLTFLDRRAQVTLAPGASVTVVAVGKAAAPMSAELHRLMGPRIRQGLIVTKEGFSMPGLPWPVHETGHPVPDERGARAAEAVAALVAPLEAQETLLVLMSGGASALLPAPLEGISLAEKQALVDRMLRTNMDIHEVNTVRKAVSRFKGGGLARLAAPAQVVGLYLSDVPGDNLSSIGSGPTVPEPVDYPAVQRLLEDKGIWMQIPEAVRQVIGSAEPVPLDAALQPVNGLVGANRHLLDAMRTAAERAGFTTKVISAQTTGLNRDALPTLLDNWRTFEKEAGAGKLCLISGGETTVEVKGMGMGGRCQELAALMLPRVHAGEVFLAAGSDGNDGPTDAAGGTADAESWERVQQEHLAYDAMLEDNDSYHLLQQSGNLIQVPPTRNNVMDVHLFLRD